MSREDKLPALRQSSTNTLYPSCSWHQFLKGFQWCCGQLIGQNPRDPGMEMLVLFSELNVFPASIVCFLVLAGQLQILEVWTDTFLLLERAAKCQLWFLGSGYSGNYWEFGDCQFNSFYISLWGPISDCYFSSLLWTTDWIKTHHICGICSWNQTVGKYFSYIIQFKSICPCFCFPVVTSSR